MSVLFEYPRELIEHLGSLTKPDAEDWKGSSQTAKRFMGRPTMR